MQRTLWRATTAAARTRFAPSPTGHLHAGGLRTALFNYLLSRKTGGQFILRLEDTDRTRFVPGATEDIIHTIEQLGLHVDEGPHVSGPFGPYCQSERLSIYNKQLEKLINLKQAYHCFCPPNPLHDAACACHSLGEQEVGDKLAAGTPHTIRFSFPAQVDDLHDAIYGKIPFSRHEALAQDFIIRKTDGFPTYHFANVVDDHEMKITHVIRGEEWLSSTPKHLALYRALGYEPPVFAHLPSLMNEAGAKLSKRDPQSGVWRKVSDLLGAYEPDAVLNFVALLGWRPSQETLEWHSLEQDDLFTLNELESLFDLGDVNKNRPRLGSTEKLDWMNKMHIRKQLSSPEGTARLVREASKLLPDIPSNYIEGALHQIANQIVTLPQALRDFHYYFKDPVLRALDDVVAVAVHDRAEIIESLAKNVEKPLKEMVKKVSEDTGLPSKKVWLMLRYALTGDTKGPPLAGLLELLGESRTRDRLLRVEKHLSH